MRLAANARRAGEALLSLFFPPHCASCGESTEAGVHLCDSCAGTVWPIKPPFCHRCSEPFDGAISDQFTCANCGDRDLHFDCAVAPFLSRGIVREFIHRFKYDRERFLRLPLADWLAHGLEDDRVSTHPFDLIVPVPLHSTRMRERGFNQAAELGALLSARCGVPLGQVLERTRYTQTQTRLDRQERMENLRNAFRVRQTAAVQNRHVMLVDDVFTTGSTVDECARILRDAGAASVRVMTVARG
ncbi:MAG: putative competence protein [Chthoniobacter sp.]|nr:putative competence protein [Chthoniobacter sp.]